MSGDTLTAGPMDPREFVYALDGNCYTAGPLHWWTGAVWWLFETAEPSVYVVIVGPQMDADEDGYFPAWDTVLVLSPDGERAATDDEEAAWEDWLRDTVREMSRG